SRVSVRPLIPYSPLPPITPISASGPFAPPRALFPFAFLTRAMRFSPGIAGSGPPARFRFCRFALGLQRLERIQIVRHDPRQGDMVTRREQICNKRDRL